MTPKRVTVKFFVQDPESVPLEDLIPVFHGWIQNKTVEGLLIDVADYKHIQNGQGTILIGDSVDYALDMSGGRPGLLLRRKYRGQPGLSLQSQLHESLSLALKACYALELEPALLGRISFRTDEVEIAFPDRFHAPNTTATFAGYARELAPVLERLYSRQEVDLQPLSADPREVLAISVRAADAPDLVTLITNLETIEQAL